MVRPSMEGPQLPSLVGETEFAIVNAALERYEVRELAAGYDGYC